jgi:hypothetical protein
LIGWHWLWALPLLFFVLFTLAPGDPLWLPIMWIGMIKLIVMVISLSFLLRGWALTKVLKARPGPFCIHCGHTLQGLPDDHRCPECGRRYRFDLVEAYRREPSSFAHQLKQRWKPPQRPMVNDRSRR